MKILKKTLKIFAYILVSLLAVYSTIIVVQKVLWRDKTPNIFGYKHFIVLSGSMSPTIDAGDIIIVKDTDNIELNDIVSFRLNNSVVTHRIVDSLEDDGVVKYITKGDANSGKDSLILDKSDIEGVYCFRIPKLGNVILFLKKPIVIFGFLVLIGGILFIYCFKPNDKKKELKEKKNKEKK